MSIDTPAGMALAVRNSFAVRELANPFRLRYLGDSVLTTPCQPVASVDEIPGGLLAAMKEICAGQHRGLVDRRPGAGLAANQAGALVAICIVKVRNEWVTMVNPRITYRSFETGWQQEGCLSIPGFETAKRRHNSIAVAFQNERLESHALTLAGVEAQCVQHELDHLAGVLITDGLSRQQRRQAERAVFKTALATPASEARAHA